MNECSCDLEQNRAVSARRSVLGHLKRALLVVAALLPLMVSTGGVAHAQSLPQCVSAFDRQDYPQASLRALSEAVADIA